MSNKINILENQQDKHDFEKYSRLPVIFLDNVIFPNTIISLIFSNPESLKILDLIFSQKYEYVLLIARKDIEETKSKISKKNDFYKIGVIVKILQIIGLPSKNKKILIESLYKVKISYPKVKNEILFAQYQIKKNDLIQDSNLLEQNLGILMNLFKEYLSYNSHHLQNIDISDISYFRNRPDYMLSLILSCIKMEIYIKQQILEEEILENKYDIVNAFLTSDNIQSKAEQSIQKRLKTQIEKSQRDFYLNEQLKAIQNELEPEKSDIESLKNKVKKSNLSLEAKEKALQEISKLKYMHNLSVEFSTVRNYLDILLDMPWGKITKFQSNIDQVETEFNKNHFGLDKIKERLLEHVALLKRSDKIKGPIICLVGPPGVGKTSLIHSVAHAMGYQYVKFALGGVSDESEIRGHRRTYVGSMPGKIINLIKKAKVDNPVMLLDEIDKLSDSNRGDPTSALLEVLDPEQNSFFRDNFLDVEYDLSKIIFIATANSYNIPRPLLDRLEIIKISGYLEEEKLVIAKQYLIKKHRNILNLKEQEFSIEDSTIIDIIRFYTKESGVRELDRLIAKLARKILLKITKTKSSLSPEKKISPKDLEKYLGVKQYDFGIAHGIDLIGSTHALAYTEYGGELLKIESAFVPGKGKIKTTGRLGNVMKESVETAYSCILSNSKIFDIDLEKFKNKDIHLHFPEGATPKDGPSAGIAIFVTIVSLMSNKSVKKEFAMTGEISLHGKILTIGGLREKLLAARRGGIKDVLIPADNVKDLKEIPQSIKSKLNIHTISKIEDIISISLFNS
ncbi:MAG: endopeptidase La [Rickettsia sp.]|nr:endopeptidase La [Rickettsia sp.]